MLARYQTGWQNKTFTVNIMQHIWIMICIFDYTFDYTFGQRVWPPWFSTVFRLLEMPVQFESPTLHQIKKHPPKGGCFFIWRNNRRGFEPGRASAWARTSGERSSSRWSKPAWMRSARGLELRAFRRSSGNPLRSTIIGSAKALPFFVVWDIIICIRGFDCVVFHLFCLADTKKRWSVS